MKFITRNITKLRVMNLESTISTKTTPTLQTKNNEEK